MYMTRLRLNPDHPQARRDLASAYEMHRTLSRAFVDSPDAQPHRFLWRLETPAISISDDSATVLIQASVPGCWVDLTERTGYLCSSLREKKVNLDSLLQRGRLCVFRLLCNPTVTRDGKRHGLSRQEEQFAWLGRQSAKHGFEVRDARIQRSEHMSWNQGRSGRRIAVQVVQFDGLLQISDPALVSAVLCNGLGHAKALGLGMLSIAPAKSFLAEIA